jgi:acyl-coenzyme A thioesterase PaaI-like protein
MKLSPNRLKWLLNFYPPYIGAGVKVDSVSGDWKKLCVSMRMRWFNRNAVGTHFGGSLYAMVDPHLMLLLMQLLGREYLVWDKSAEIEFVKATRSRVFSVIEIPDETLLEIVQNTSHGEKYLPRFDVDIKNEEKELVARVKKILYVRKKKHGVPC